MRIISYETGVRFNIGDEAISELATYGVLKKGSDGLCEIANPIYQYCIAQTFQVNGGFRYRSTHPTKYLLISMA